MCTMSPPSDCLCSRLGRGCWSKPQTQTPAGGPGLTWTRRRAAFRGPGSYRGRPRPTEPPANRSTPPKPLSGKTGGRSGVAVGGGEAIFCVSCSGDARTWTGTNPVTSVKRPHEEGFLQNELIYLDLFHEAVCMSDLQ